MSSSSMMPELPRRSSRNHLPTARSVDCLSSAHNNNFKPSFCNNAVAPADVSSRSMRDESPAMLRSTSFSKSAANSNSMLNAQCSGQALVAANTLIAASKMYVAFEIVVETQWGDSAVLVGSTAQLGSWKPECGMRMNTDSSSYPIWHVSLPLDCDESSLEFKVVILRADGSADWEPLPDNRRLSLFAGREVRVRATWNDPLEEESHVKNSQLAQVSQALQAQAAQVQAVQAQAAQAQAAQAQAAQATAAAHAHMGAGLAPAAGLAPSTTPSASVDGQRPRLVHPGAPEAVAAPPNMPPNMPPAFGISLPQLHSGMQPGIQPGVGFAAFNYAPRPNHSFSIPGAMPSHVAPAQAGHAAFDPAKAMALLAGQCSVNTHSAPPQMARPPAAPPPKPSVGPMAAMPPPPPMGAAPMGAAPASGGHIRRGCSDLDIAASPPSGVPVGLVLPEAIPRVGQPLASVKSQDMSWPPSIGSMSGAGSETSLHSTPCA